MFGKEKDDTDHAGTGAVNTATDGRKSGSQQAAAPSIISADMKVVGNLQSGGDIQIEGSVEGDIKSRTVTIGENAHINGAINADMANVHGHVKGKINASSVRISKTANIQGDIKYETLSIEEGAVIDGQIRCNDSDAKSEAIKKPLSGNSATAAPTATANVAPIKPSSVAPSASGMKSSGGKPLAS